MNAIIEKLIYGGDGLARIAGSDGRSKALFVPFTLAGEEVVLRALREKKGFGRAEAQEILSPSPYRVDPGCPYFFRCGGCHYQHASNEHQLEIKRGILRETLARGAKLDWPGEITIHSADPWNYRNRTRMHVRHAPEFRIGYYRHSSNDLLAIENCPISSPLINRAIAQIWKLSSNGTVPAAVAEIEFFANHDDSQLLLELYLGTSVDRAVENALKNFVSALREELLVLIGAAAFAIDDFSNTPLWTWGTQHITYKTAAQEYRVSAGSFFQVNRFLTGQMADAVCSGQSGRRALDLYAGTGLFSLPLAQTFEKVIAVESAPTSFADLEHNAPANVKVRPANTQQYLQSAADLECEFAVVDPPRAGLGSEVAKQLGNMDIQRLAYVSCDPTTLARDLQPLLAAGFKVTAMHLFDLFPQTFHLETLVHLAR
jgi:23S rRNA (uracil1939-C5)-methyltransferase